MNAAAFFHNYCILCVRIFDENEFTVQTHEHNNNNMATTDDAPAISPSFTAAR